MPDALDREGVRRYGFHGLSYEYVLSVARAGTRRRGSSSRTSATARAWSRCKDGAAIDTTMGFTPTGGIPMGTRTGDLDPGVLLYLARERGYSTSTCSSGSSNTKSGLARASGAPPT